MGGRVRLPFSLANLELMFRKGQHLALKKQKNVFEVDQYYLMQPKVIYIMLDIDMLHTVPA